MTDGTIMGSLSLSCFISTIFIQYSPNQGVGLGQNRYCFTDTTLDMVLGSRT